jgi:hypothetical protein
LSSVATPLPDFLRALLAACFTGLGDLMSIFPESR